MLTCPCRQTGSPDGKAVVESTESALILNGNGLGRRGEVDGAVGSHGSDGLNLFLSGFAPADGSVGRIVLIGRQRIHLLTWLVADGKDGCG